MPRPQCNAEAGAFRPSAFTEGIRFFALLENPVPHGGQFVTVVERSHMLLTALALFEYTSGF